MLIMWFFFCLHNKAKPFNLAAVFGAGSHDIDAGSVDGTVTKNVRQLGDVLFNAIEGTGEQLAQIMGKDLTWFYTCGFAQLFHCRPDVTAV